MIKKTALLLLSGVLFWSCSKEDPNCDSCQEDATAKVDVVFQFKTTETKSIGTPPNAEASDNISNFQIFIFNDNNHLENTAYFNETSKHTAVTMKAKPGVKDFYAVVNYGKAITDISRKEDLAALISNIEDKSSQKPDFLMVAQLFNKTIKDLSSDHSSNDVYLEANRLVSRVQLRYKLDFSNSNYKDKTFYVDSVYLLNATTQSTYTYPQEDAKIITSKLADGLRGYKNPFMESLCETGKWDKDKGFFPGPTEYDWFYFYTFANQPTDLDKATRIVISAMLDGSRTYYPIIINKTGTSYEGGGVPSHSLIKNNALYLITATIKGRGSDTPEIIEYIDLNVNVEIKDWSNISQETDFTNTK